MKTRNILILAGLGLLGYYWWKSKQNKPLIAKDLTNNNPLGSGAAPTPVVIPEQEALLKDPLTVEDLSNKNAYKRGGKMVVTRRARVVMPKQQPIIKEPIIGQPINLVPNVYGDNINLPIERSREVFVQGGYQNFTGSTNDIQNACKCNKQNKQRYRLNIPQLP